MKRVLVIILALLIGVSVLSACGGSIGDPPPLPTPRVRSASTPVPTLPPAPPPAPPTSAPTAAPPGEDQDDGSTNIIPPNGGEFIVGEETLFTFTPRETGVWEITTTNSGRSDPILDLLDDRGNDIIWDDDSNGGLDARIIRLLKGGTEYQINVRFWSLSDPTTLVVHSPHVIDFPNTGGVLDVWQETYLLFRPAQAGSWLFETSDNGDSDPVLELFDADGDWIMGDDDSGEGMNARFTATLEAGKDYYLHARFWFHTYDSDQSFVVTVSPNN